MAGIWKLFLEIGVGPPAGGLDFLKVIGGENLWQAKK